MREYNWGELWFQKKKKKNWGELFIQSLVKTKNTWRVFSSLFYPGPITFFTVSTLVIYKGMHKKLNQNLQSHVK